MEDEFEVIENNFEKGVENLDKSFIDELKEKKEMNPEIEKNYKEQLHSLKDRYEEESKDVLKSKKIFSSEKEEKKEEEGEGKNKFEGHFKVEKVDFSQPISEQVSAKKELFLFSKGIDFRNFFRKITPAAFILAFLDLKLSTKIFIIDSKSFLKTAGTKIKLYVVNFFKKIGEIFMKVFSGIKKVFGWIGSIFKKKEAAGKEGEKKEGEENKEGASSETPSGKQEQQTNSEAEQETSEEKPAEQPVESAETQPQEVKPENNSA